LLDADVFAERGLLRLRGAEVGLVDRRALFLERLERRDLLGVEARLVPLRLVERRARVCVARDLAQPAEDGALAGARIHRLAHGEPEAALRIGPVAVVVTRRPRPGFHLGAHHRPPPYRAPRSCTRRFTVEMMVSGGVSWRRMSATPI